MTKRIERRGRPKGSKKTGAMTETLRARCSKALYQRVQFVAETCSGGDVAKWLRYAALAAPRRILK